jgi:alpha-1,4-galacturonosyltransferase
MLVAVVKEPIHGVASVVGAHNKKGVVAAMDYDTELGHDGVSRRDIDRRSVSDRSSESTVSNDNVLWNGEENEGGGVT